MESDFEIKRTFHADLDPLLPHPFVTPGPTGALHVQIVTGKSAETPGPVEKEGQALLQLLELRFLCRPC